MEIRRLKHLVALADTGNFGRAAQKCHLSQPAFSRSIQAAEEELGLLLFDRGSAEAKCTDAGAFVVERARKLVFDNHCMERDVSLYRERLIGDVALGVGPYPSATLVPALLTDVRTKFPGVNVRVEVNNASYLAEHLRAEELDFYVADLRNVPATSDFEVTRIGQLSAGYYVRAGHPLLSIDHIGGASLMPYGIASVRLPEVILRKLAPLMGLPEGTLVPLVVECDDLTVLKTLAMATDTVLGCADVSTLQEVADKRLVRLAVANIPPLYSDLGIVTLKGRSYSPMAQYAADFLEKLAKEQTAG